MPVNRAGPDGVPCRPAKIAASAPAAASSLPSNNILFFGAAVMCAQIPAESLGIANGTSGGGT